MGGTITSTFRADAASKTKSWDLSEYELRPALQNPLSAFTWRGTSVYRFHEVCQECISLSPRPHFSRPPESSLGTRLSVYKSAYSVAIHLSYETQKTREK